MNATPRKSATKYNTERIAQRLKELGKRHGITWKPFHVSVYGEFLLAVEGNDPDHREACGEFGTLAPILSRYHWRCGTCGVIAYGYHKLTVEPKGGWLFMRTAEIAQMLDDEGIDG